ncbi:hypothetical protein KSB_04810 [Ktedonobacter robiniae]|uniref:SHSP domain-containing protein n=1 Tax=Ktedonobacter robiniae TaxID=2778365 RepID=A0ABQ3UH14_9CHLR|nr:hypothetical protein KSB_04810 [Ktedonobacter robiniae]
MLRREIRTEAFERNVTFDRPLDPDNITVSYDENGILELDIPAREEARARHISVTSTKQAKAMGAGQTEQAAQGGQTTQQQAQGGQTTQQQRGQG